MKDIFFSKKVTEFQEGRYYIVPDRRWLRIPTMLSMHNKPDNHIHSPTTLQTISQTYIEGARMGVKQALHYIHNIYYYN